MALVNPCTVGATIKNTGSECSEAMLATYGLILMPASATWTATDELNFTAKVNTMRHASAATRWLPIFGRNAKISSIADSPEADVMETQENGQMDFIRHGMYNRTFLTTKGGLCLAQAFAAIPRDYAFVELDEEGKVNRMVNSDGTFSGFPVNLMYSPTPELANLKTTHKNKFYMSFSKVDYIDNGGIVKGDSTENILALRGLIDSEVTLGTATQTTTNIFIGARTICAHTDLVDLYTGTGAGKIGQIANFIVTKVSDGSVVTPSAVAIVAGEVRLTGTYTSGASYYVAFAAASVLKANGIEGYEGIAKATVPIP